MSSSSDRQSRRGFTLLELLVVLAIIALLAALVGPAVFRHVGDAKTNAARSQIELLALALEAYRLDNDEYPTTKQGLDALRRPPLVPPPRNWRGPYLRKAVPLDPWGRPYRYESPGRHEPATFDLQSLGRDGEEGGVDEDSDITSWGDEARP